MPDTTPTPLALSLDTLGTAGATVWGRRVVRLIAVTEDGSRVAIKLPLTPAVVEAEESGSNSTPLREDVLEAVQSIPLGETRSAQQIADAAGWPLTNYLRDYVKTLADTGLLERLSGNRGWKRIAMKS